MGKYDARIQETSLLNLAYKGLYLMQAMGQFSKDNAFRDDITSRIAGLAKGINFENPSDVNQGLMDGISQLAMDADGNFVDEEVVKPYYLATKTYFDAIQPITLRKEGFDTNFFKANDLVLASQSKAGSGHYDSEQALAALSKVESGFIKNANLFGTSQRLLFQEEIKKRRKAIDVIRYLESNDIDKELKGVQIDMQNLDKQYAFEGETTQHIFDKAALLVEQNQYEDARKVLVDLENRDELRDRKIEKYASHVKGFEAELNQTIQGVKVGRDGKTYMQNPILNKLLSSDAKISETFLTKESMKDPHNWRTLYNSKLEALAGVVEDVAGDEYTAEDLMNNENLKIFLHDLTGDKPSTFQDYGSNSEKIADVVKSYVKYLKQLNKSHKDMFGKENALFSEDNDETSFLSDLGFVNPYPK